MFDPSVGRWMSTDPIDFDAGDANLYRYVGNNPTNLTDPTGLKGWPPQETSYYRDPWVEPKQGESREMIVATVSAQIKNIDEKKGTYRLAITISSEIPAQKVSNPLIKGGKLPKGVNLRTEQFLRFLEPLNRNLTDNSRGTLSVRFENPAPLKQPFVEVDQWSWPLPNAQALALPKNIVWSALPGGKVAKPSVITINSEFRLWGRSGEGSGSIVMNGINTNAQGNPLPMPLPMRPIYLSWSFDLEDKKGTIKIEQHGKPYIEGK